YTSLRDNDIKEGNLGERFDAIILPDDPTPFIAGEGIEEWWKEHRPHRPLPVYPPEYRSGIGEEGVEALRRFVEDGGTLVALNRSCGFAVETLGLKVRDVLAGVPSKEFFCPGSTLHARVDLSHPLGYGMPGESLVFFWDSPAFEVLPSGFNDLYEIVVSYPDGDILQSGWLIGEERLRRRAAMISARVGEGRVVLIGFRAQHRAQTHGTFKLLFNSLLGRTPLFHDVKWS
ncbi:MAG: peptidase M14 family protein, partial [Candidatus Bathyarchaeia archaeon]